MILLNRLKSRRKKSDILKPKYRGLNVTIHPVRFTNFLEIKSVGVISSIEAFKHHGKLVFELGQKHKTKNILLDQRELNSPSEHIELQEFLTFVMKKLPPEVTDMRFAIVGQQQHEEVNDFGELYGENRGMKVKTFVDIDEARNWMSVG